MSELSRDPPDFLPTASLTTLRVRGRLLAALRRFFEARGYWEVETPLLSHDVTVDAWLEPFVARWRADAADETAPDAAGELFLQTSPEFGMKRLLAAGATAIYQVTRALRNAEFGRLHNPEFTMVEWYRSGDSHWDQMELVERLVIEAFRAVREACAFERHPARDSGLPAQPATPFARTSYDAAFERHAGTRVLDLPAGELAALARDRGVSPPSGLGLDDRDGWLNLLLAELVEPHLGRDRPEFVYDYPATQAALARICPAAPPVAERFELYVRGIEVCNGYHELTDPAELRKRMGRQAELRRKHGLRSLPLENRLLAAMEAGLPPCAGVALGFDRLLMLALGATSLAEVMAFPFDRA